MEYRGSKSNNHARIGVKYCAAGLRNLSTGASAGQAIDKQGRANRRALDRSGLQVFVVGVRPLAARADAVETGDVRRDELDVARATLSRRQGFDGTEPRIHARLRIRFQQAQVPGRG